jgi:hypothetical protein
MCIQAKDAGAGEYSWTRIRLQPVVYPALY